MNIVVKICGITHPEDASDAVDAGADALGFVFAESPRRVTAKQAAEISRQLPEHILRVAVMLHPENADWIDVAETFSPDVLQTDAGDYASLDVDDAIRRWPVYRQGGASAPADGAGEFVYEGMKSGQGQAVDWKQAAAVAAAGRMLLAGGLGPGNVADAIRQVRPWGVDASSSLERRPGRKDREKMVSFVAAARMAAAEIPEGS